MSTRLADEPAVLEWFPSEIKTVGRHQPIQVTRQRMSFETVAAAVGYATSSLPEVVQEQRDDRDRRHHALLGRYRGDE